MAGFLGKVVIRGRVLSLGKSAWARREILLYLLIDASVLPQLKLELLVDRVNLRAKESSCDDPNPTKYLLQTKKPRLSGDT